MQVLGIVVACASILIQFLAVLQICGCSKEHTAS